MLIQSRIREAIQSRKEAERWAEAEIKQLLQPERLLLIPGILLYWAEGTKLNDKEKGHKGVEFTNTDSRIVTIMMKFFRGVLHVPENKLRIMVRIGKDGNVESRKVLVSNNGGKPYELPPTRTACSKRKE